MAKLGPLGTGGDKLVLCGSLGWIANYGMLANADPARPALLAEAAALLLHERLHAAHDVAGDPLAPFNNRTAHRKRDGRR